MKLLQLGLILVAMPTLAIFLNANRAEAQGGGLPCGDRCVSCGYLMSAGTDESEDGLYEIQCEPFAQCSELDCGELISATHPSTTSLLEQVSEADATGLQAVVREHTERMLIHPTRNLLVILHRTECNPDELANNLQSVAFVTEEKMTQLVALGVRYLDDFISGTFASSDLND